jgi:lipopolysaccharide biosynthesis protein
VNAPRVEPRVRALAFYLPQFHPIPENDEWWGPGFTDWRNVEKARPRFRGHYQPHVPAELGFYDLRDPEVRERQAELAGAHGVSGFCYYHYWFKGRRLLHQPLDEVLATGRPNFPFCLCWANENWTRVWDGRSDNVLVEQRYSEEDDRAHMGWLAGVFSDERYIRVEGKPLFLVYRARGLRDPAATARIWREEAHRLGAGEIFLARVESFHEEHDDPREIGFDAAVEFQPDMANLPRPLRRGRGWDALRRLGLASTTFASSKVLEYADVVERALTRPRPRYVRFPCVTPSWDNSPRRAERAWILVHSTPELYEHWLREAVLRAPEAHPLVFVNAWNEWAEGNHLEPCERWGRAYLEATRRALSS